MAEKGRRRNFVMVNRPPVVEEVLEGQRTAPEEAQRRNGDH